GVVPAVIAAPRTSSVLLPAGTSWALIFSFGCAEFHELTMALPHCTSCSLFEYQMVMGPWAFIASLEPPPLDPHAARAPAIAVAVMMLTMILRRCMVCVPLLLSVLAGCGSRSGGTHH